MIDISYNQKQIHHYRPTQQDELLPPVSESVEYEPIDSTDGSEIDTEQEAKAEGMTGVTSTYETVELDEQTNFMRDNSMKMDAMPRDSMIDNSAYDRQIFNYNEPQTLTGMSGEASEGKHGQPPPQYEEVVVLQDNSSYGYITT